MQICAVYPQNSSIATLNIIKNLVISVKDPNFAAF